MKKLILLAVGIVLSVGVLTGCSTIKYCAVDGCPKEATYQSKYCSRHKCWNSNCHNLATSNGYCEKCLKNASK